MSLANRRTDLHALNNFSSSIDKVSFKKKKHVSRPCSFGGEVVHAVLLVKLCLFEFCLAIIGTTVYEHLVTMAASDQQLVPKIFFLNIAGNPTNFCLLVFFPICIFYFKILK